MVIGKNKKQFEKWCCSLGKYVLYNNKYLALVDSDGCFIVYFDELPFEMRLGVYLAYYDSKGYRINVENFMDAPDYFRFKINGSGKYDKEALSTLQEAYKEAFKQADKLMNK